MILGIETSTAVTSVALGGEDGSLATRVQERARGHVEFLMPAILGLCAEGGTDLRALSGVAVGIGPGLFTGMRVGIQTAKTLAHVLAVPLTGICSLDVLAFGARPSPRLVCACIDAKRGEMFVATYRSRPDGLQRVGEPRALTADALVADLGARGEGVLLVGDGAVVYRDTLAALDGAEINADVRFPRAEHLVSLVRGAHTEVVDPAALEPMYVRRSDAEIRWEERGVTIERPFRVKVPKRAAAGGHP